MASGCRGQASGGSDRTWSRSLGQAVEVVPRRLGDEADPELARGRARDRADRDAAHAPRDRGPASASAKRAHGGRRRERHRVGREHALGLGAAGRRACGRAARRRPRRRRRAGRRAACRAPPRRARRARACPSGRRAAPRAAPRRASARRRRRRRCPTSRSAAAVPGPIAATRRARERAGVAAAALQQQARGVRRGHADEAVGARRRSAGPASGSMRMTAHSIDLGAEIAQPRDEAAGLGAGARDDDAAAVQRPQLGPGDLVAQRGHRADHGDRGRADAGRRDVGGDRRERAARRCAAAAVRARLRRRTPASSGGLPPAISARGDRRRAAPTPMSTTSVPRQRGQRAPVDVGRAACRAARAPSRS